MKRIIKISLWTLLFIILTILSQIGGIVLIISLLIHALWKPKFKVVFPLIFMGLYLITSLGIIPVLAPIFGRQKIKNTDGIKPATFMTIILNRNYVVPVLNDLLIETEQHLIHSNIEIVYLDANFPFINSFPLLPHLSHNDGRKIDIALVYVDEQGNISSHKKSVSGYGVFEAPLKNEENQINKCLKSGYFQYDYPKYFSFGRKNHDLEFSPKATKELIISILKSRNLGKMFIEPHLKQRMKLEDKRIRFHGCRSVRHDDHIHIQLK